MAGYAPATHALLNDAGATSIDSDPDRFRIEVADVRANTDDATQQTLAVTVETLDGAEEVDDAGGAVDLVESGLADKALFSEKMLLMSPNLPLNADDDIAVWSSRAGAAVEDDARNDRTRRATIDGQVRVVYEAEGETFTKLVPVTKRDPAPQQTGQAREGRLRLRFRVRVHLEPYLDEGVAAVALAPGAQFVGLRAENGALVPHVYQVGPDDQTVGAGDGMFTFLDADGDGEHGPGEVSERYLDLSRGVEVNADQHNPLDSFYKAGDHPDHTSGDGWGQVTTNQDVLDQIERANIAWAQAGIRVELAAGLIVEAAPVGAAEVDVLQDGWFLAEDLNSFTPLAPTMDGLTTIEAIGAQAEPDLLEVVFTGPLPGAFGLANFPLGHGDLPAALQNNTYVFMGPNLDIRNRTLAHEIGHALTNRVDAAPVPYIFTPYQPDEEFPLPGDDSVPWQYRRLRHDTEANARTLRDPGCLHCVGNLLLHPEGNEEGTQ